MKLSKIEEKLFIKVHLKLNELINDSNIEKLVYYFDEDLDFRLNTINEIIELLSQEKEMVNDLIIGV